MIRSQPLFLAPVRTLVAASAASALGLAAPHAVAAVYTSSVFAASGTINLSGPTDERTVSNSSPTALQAASQINEVLVPSLSSGEAHGESASSASASAGGLRLVASALGTMRSVNGGNAGGSGIASATASLEDSFTIVANCVIPVQCAAGAEGMLTFGMRFDAGLGGNGGYATTTPDNVSGGWTVQGEWNSGGSLGTGIDGATWLRGESYSLTRGFAPVTGSTNGGAGTQTWSVLFRFGEPISLRVDGHVSAQAGVQFDYFASQGGNGGSSGTASYLADLGHTIGWNGILALQDASGAAVTSFTARNTDGSFDYAQALAVPEPQTWALMLAGVLCVAGVAVTRRDHALR